MKWLHTRESPAEDIESTLIRVLQSSTPSCIQWIPRSLSNTLFSQSNEAFTYLQSREPDRRKWTLRKLVADWDVN